MSLADVHLEWLGNSPWWLAAACIAGMAMLIHAGLPLIRGRGASRAGVATALGGIAGIGACFCLVWRAGWLTAGPRATSTLMPLVLLLLLAAAVVVFYRGAGGSLTPARRGGLMALRIAGMGALVLLLFRPVVAIVKEGPDAKPRLRIIVDASASMSYNDAANQPSRYRESVLAIENALFPRLEKVYHIDTFTYDGVHHEPVGGMAALDALTPNGDVTDLGAALSLGAGGTTPAGTVLFSDGIHNGPVAIQAEVARLNPGAVHTVRVGSSDLEPSAVPDIAVVDVDGPQTAIVNNQVTLTATIKSTAMSDRTVSVQLLTQGDATPIEQQRLVLKSGSAGQTVMLHFTPDKVGRATVRVRVPVDPAERSEANNQQDFSLLVTDPKLGVLYVEGRVRPEVGPLRRTLEQDPNLAAVSMVQTVAGRFDLAGTKTGDDLKGLPTTLAQWKRFKVIILGDLDASFLSGQQQRDLEQAVRDGAGLLMIGGQNSFAPGGWDKTTLATLLPVSLEKVTPAQINTPFVPQLTAIGAAHPIFRGIAGYFSAPGRPAPDIAGLPDLTGCVALAGAKPGATVLAVHPKEKVNGEPAIVLAVQQYGKGRTAAFAADTTFRWSLVLRGMQKDSPYNRFWGQLVRWLASEETLDKKTGASVTAMLAKERFSPDEPVPLRAAVTDKDGQATNFAQAWADVAGPDGKTTRVPLVAQAGDGGDAGIYQAFGDGYKPAMAGTYQVTFGAAKDNADLGKDQSTFTVLPAAGERDVLAAEPKTLQEISRLTGGSAVDLSGVDALADRLLATAPQTAAATPRTIPLSRPRPFFLLFVLCLGTEWLLRRRWQMH